MLWLGLSGGIATGKSTVTHIIQTFGYGIVDADELARIAVAPGSVGLKQVIQTFGQLVENRDGSLNRAKLAHIVFHDRHKLLLLENIIHPIIHQLALAQKSRFQNENKEIAFYDVPLLFEKKMETEFDATIVVFCTPEEQINRLISRDHLSKVEAQNRINSQMPIDEKVKLANYVIDNSQDFAFLQNEVEKMIQFFTKPTHKKGSHNT